MLFCTIQWRKGTERWGGGGTCDVRCTASAPSGWTNLVSVQPSRGMESFIGPSRRSSHRPSGRHLPHCYVDTITIYTDVSACSSGLYVILSQIHLSAEFFFNFFLKFQVLVWGEVDSCVTAIPHVMLRWWCSAQMLPDAPYVAESTSLLRRRCAI